LKAIIQSRLSNPKFYLPHFEDFPVHDPFLDNFDKYSIHAPPQQQQQPLRTGVTAVKQLAAPENTGKLEMQSRAPGWLLETKALYRYLYRALLKTG